MKDLGTTVPENDANSRLMKVAPAMKALLRRWIHYAENRRIHPLVERDSITLLESLNNPEEKP